MTMTTEATNGRGRRSRHGIRIPAAREGWGRPNAEAAIRPDVIARRLVLVNICAVGAPGGPWVLVDAGIPGTASAIRDLAARRFGGRPPEAIVLTHAHFDHRGALGDLLDDWDVPVYAHRLEMPYITGRSAYPPPDPTVGGGAMAALSRFYPRRPIDLGARARELPADGSVPGMPGWTWLATPGHTPGHVSFWRESDRTLIAGDAFVATKQESAAAVAIQRSELNGPPAYFTPDWANARRSMALLAQLAPEYAVTGHGPPLAGAVLRRALELLVDEFDEAVLPEHGRYVGWAAQADEGGVTSVPPPVPDPVYRLAVAGGVAAVLGLAVWQVRKRRR